MRRRALLVGLGLMLVLVTPLPPPRPARATDRAPATLQDCPDCPVMVAVPGGVLARGDGPPVPVAPFLMGRTEVTFDQWGACVAAGACRGSQSDHGWGRGNRPVINVTFQDATDYVGWLSDHTGRPYRLPAEDEWEWAARAGTSTAYWWGDAMEPGRANCRKCDAQWGGKMSSPVASFPANPFGLHDMAGNLWEWTATCWSDNRTAPADDRDCRIRAAKGGAWYYIPSQSRHANRAPHAIALRSYTVGFRVAAPAE